MCLRLYGSNGETVEDGAAYWMSPDIDPRLAAGDARAHAKRDERRERKRKNAREMEMDERHLRALGYVE